MNRQEWARVKEVFQKALETAEDERARFLDDACGGDDALRAEVESLLASHSAAGDFISQPLITVIPSGFEPTGTPAHSHIGPYRVVEQLGVGGMGHVYLGVRDDGAFDKKVAIKVIRASRATPAILKRFRDERQIMADVDHPHIGRLLDGGSTDDGLPYFIMEYVDGEAVDAYCDAHELTITERLELFTKVCDAVHFANSKHVIHRDLKPGNILVTRDGNPKLLDFGIAKTMVAEEDAPTAEVTAVGERVLTPSYASPEQVRGMPATSASDVYSLGVILYLLLTGLRPYTLDDVIDYEKVICEKEPQSPSGLVAELIHAEDTEGIVPAVSPRRVAKARATTPGDLRDALAGDLDGIVLGALAKSPSDRYATAAALAADIRRHLEGEPVLGPAGRGVVPAQDSPPRPLSLRGARAAPQWRIPAAAGLLIAALAALAWMTGLRPLARNQPTPAPVPVGAELSFLPPDGVSFTEGDRNKPAVSRDGAMIVYVGTETATGETGLWLRPLGEDTASKIEGTEGAMYPFWSADHTWVGFFADQELRIAYLDRRPGIKLADATLEARGATANTDDVVVFVPDEGEALHRVDASGRGLRLLSRPRSELGETAYLWPQFLPDGNRFIFFVASDDAAVEGIYVSSLEDPQERRRLLGTTSNGWYASGYLLYPRNNQLMAVRTDPGTLEVIGQERPLQFPVATTRGLQSGFSASQSGVLAYISSDVRQLHWVDWNNNDLGSIFEPGTLWNPAYAPATRRAAIEQHAEGQSMIHILELVPDRDEPVVSSVPADSSRALHPVWDATGRILAFSARSGDQHGLYRWNVDRPGQPELLYTSTDEKMPTDISPDGRYLVFAERPVGGDWDIKALDMTVAGSDPIALITTPNTDASGRISPSGDWIAYASDNRGQTHVYVERFRLASADAQQTPLCTISTSSGYDPHWGEGDTELYYLERGGNLMRATLDLSGGCNPARREVVFRSTVETPGISRNHYAIDFAQQRLLFNTPVSEASPFNIHTNWLERLDR